MAFSLETESSRFPSPWDMAPPLTWEEFLSSLPRGDQLGTWVVARNGSIRLDYCGHHMGVIPAVRFNRMAKLPCEKIHNNWRVAAEEIRLPMELGQRIHDAVKNKPGHDPELRAAILGRIGLRDLATPVQS